MRPLPKCQTEYVNILDVQPNAGHQARPEAEARDERTLYAVACLPWLGAGCVREPFRETCAHTPD